MKIDGKVGVWNGKTVCYCDPKDYFKSKAEYDNSDYVFVMTDTDYMVHHGMVIGKLVNGNRVDLWSTTTSIDKYYKAKTANKPVTEVTKRHTIEWYMEHTIEILNDGVKYGEKRLRELAERRVK